METKITKLSAEQIQSAIELAKRITTTYESGGDATWPAIAYALLDVYGRLQEAGNQGQAETWRADAAQLKCDELRSELTEARRQLEVARKELSGISGELAKVTKAPFSRGDAYCEWFTCKSCRGAVTVVSSLNKPAFCPNCGRKLDWITPTEKQS